MNNKYVMIGGLAFSEEDDMEKLRAYASQGWILEGIAGGFFYKLRKDKPQDIVYSLDYQTESSEEYFSIFKEAGWEPVVSIENHIHIFSAQAGTKPIYSDCGSEIDKYTSIKERTKKGTVYSLIAAIPLMGLLLLSLTAGKTISPILVGLLIINLCVFVFNFMPYIAYNSRIKEIKQHGKCDRKAIDYKGLGKLNAGLGVLWLAIGIWDLSGKRYFSAVFFIVLSLIYFKKYTKSVK